MTHGGDNSASLPMIRDRENSDGDRPRTPLFNDSMPKSPASRSKEARRSSSPQATEAAVRSKVAEEMEQETQQLEAERQAADDMRRAFREERMQTALKQINSFAATAPRLFETEPDAFDRARAQARYTTLVRGGNIASICDESIEESNRLKELREIMVGCRARLTALSAEAAALVRSVSGAPTVADLSQMLSLHNRATDAYAGLRRAASQFATSRLLLTMLQRGMAALVAPAKIPVAKVEAKTVAEESEEEAEEPDEESSDSDSGAESDK